MRPQWRLAPAVAIALLAALAAGRASSQSGKTRTALPVTIETRTGDFDVMLKKRVVRVLVPYSRTLYFSDKGKERGITAESVRDLEQFLNQKHRKSLHNRPITVVLIPTPRAQLIPYLLQGLGDIAAGNLTVTPDRLAQVDFTAPPELRAVSELPLTRKPDGPLASVDALSGRTVHVRASSSYNEHLRVLNALFERAGTPPVNVVAVPDLLEDEDLMEMLDAGVVSTIIVDDWKAKMWAQVLPNIVVNENAAVHSGGQIGWAYRKNSPLLAAELDEFYYKFEKQRGAIPYRFSQYNKQIKRLQDPTGRNDWKRFQETVAIFEKYGAQYGFDPLLLVAQGFQESKLDQSVRSPVGAIGVMQLMPDTGASMKVGDVTITEPNIHAGAKYMNTIMTNYFADAHFDEMNRTLFAFASYNAGPNRIAKLRKTAATRGLDPDVWFENVEVVVSEKIGRETTTYVRNILKYYVSYKLTLEMQQAQQKARDELAPASGN
ncbi:MAG TPA: transporter substrate-binding domain-containing protein [Candidatus Krumholzibacteria bacterium]|nr:transporter substrate-binding domain-containing protein [Candidatus Krumholzibacteria bacterium]